MITVAKLTWRTNPGAWKAQATIGTHPGEHLWLWQGHSLVKRPLGDAFYLLSVTPWAKQAPPLRQGFTIWRMRKKRKRRKILNPDDNLFVSSKHADASESTNQFVAIDSLQSITRAKRIQENWKFSMLLFGKEFPPSIWKGSFYWTFFFFTWSVCKWHFH